jgi:hypothetical protein
LVIVISEIESVVILRIETVTEAKRRSAFTRSVTKIAGVLRASLRVDSPFLLRWPGVPQSLDRPG